MNAGRTLFAQVMEYVPWKTFGPIIKRHNGDSGMVGNLNLFNFVRFYRRFWPIKQRQGLGTIAN